jgi:glutamate racemase
LLADEIRAAYPAIAQVDGAAGIARRIAFLTRGQQWPETPPAGLAVFTAEPPDSLARAFVTFGLEHIRTF